MSAPGGRIRIATGVLVLAMASLLVCSPALALPVAAQPVALDGPSADVVSLAGVAVARDGTGGLAYLKRIDGVPHVFVSALTGGSFRAPRQVDAGLPGPASQPVIAAGMRGLLLVAFVSGGQLYVVQRGGGSAGFGPPASLAVGGVNPALQITSFDKGYLAFTVPSGTGSDVRSAFYNRGHWSIEPSALNAVTGDDAGQGAGRPAVAASGDGVATVAWGESGHIFTRRVWGDAPSVILEQADGDPRGCSELAADSPAVGVGGDSSFVTVAFREAVRCGPVSRSRVFMNRLHGSQYDGLQPADGLPDGRAAGASEPQVGVGEYGFGFVASTLEGTQDIHAQQLRYDGATGGQLKVNSGAMATDPHVTVGVAGLYVTTLAWQQDPGSAGLPEIRLRYALDGITPAPEQILSTPALGPTDAAQGLSSAGDYNGNLAVAWVQGAPGQRRIVAVQLFEAPSGFGPLRPFAYALSAHPVLSWTPSRQHWGVRYSVTVDGRPVGLTQGTSFRVASSLPDGSHVWQVAALGGGGQRRIASPAQVFVDTTAPRVRFSLRGKLIPRSPVQAFVGYVDLPHGGGSTGPVGAEAASGVKTVAISWGDARSTQLPPGYHRARHAYTRRGRYRILVTVLDRAGNSTRLVRYVAIGLAGSPRGGGKRWKAPKPRKAPAGTRRARR